MSIALITGSCGLIGSESVKFFLKKGFDVIGIDNNTRKKLFGLDGDISLVQKQLNRDKHYYHKSINIINYSSLETIFKNYGKQIQIIIHTAAQPSHDWAYQSPILDFKINAEGTLNLLELFKKYSSTAKFVFTSTNKVYGDTPNQLRFYEKKYRYELKSNHKFYNGINENMNIDNSTHSLFGVSKAYADLAVQEYGKNFGLNTVCFRGGCLTGPSHKGAKLHGFLSYLVKCAIKNKTYTILGYKGKQVRDNIHSYDFINCIWEYYKKPIPGEVFNIGGTRFSNCSILEAVNLIEKITSTKMKIKFSKQQRTGDHQWYITNMQKFYKYYPKYKLTYSIKNILEEIIEEVK